MFLLYKQSCNFLLFNPLPILTYVSIIGRKKTSILHTKKNRSLLISLRSPYCDRYPAYPRCAPAYLSDSAFFVHRLQKRSEERRVGKECRSRGWECPRKEKKGR